MDVHAPGSTSTRQVRKSTVDVPSHFPAGSIKEIQMTIRPMTSRSGPSTLRRWLDGSLEKPAGDQRIVNRLSAMPPTLDGVSRPADPLVAAVIARLVAGDPLAAVLVAAAVRDHPRSFDAAAAFVVAVDPAPEHVARARALANTRRDRQHLVIIECWRNGELDRVQVLARDHLSSFPDDVVISWLAGQP
jgi:hypothetical protein